MEARFDGPTSHGLRKLASELTKRKGIAHKFDLRCGPTGIDWLKEFVKRHPGASYRKPEPTSAARALGLNRVAEDNFFEPLG